LKQISLNLLIGEGLTDSGNRIVFPLQLPHVVRINMSPNDLAGQVYKVIHEKLLKKGFYDTLLKYSSSQELLPEPLEVIFDTSRELLFPKTTLLFDFFYFQHEASHFIGFVPVLCLESVGNTLEELRENMRENIKLEFVRKRRLQSVQSILTSQWFSEIIIHTIPLNFNFYTLYEQEQEKERENQEILPHISQRMQSQNPGLFGLDAEADRLITALRSRSSVIITGDSGKGKTTLVRHFVSQKHQQGMGNVSVWEVSAAQLLHRLMGLGSWEEHLAYLCNELRKKGDILYIHNFAELFEVGQYVGNNMSLADYLRDYIARGEIQIVSECTPEQAALIELRSPGYLALFTQVKIEEMTDSQIRNIVLKKVKLLASAKSCKIDEEAILEILRLQQWYTPYSGLPGKTIHFSETLLADKEKKEQKHIHKADIYAKFCEETGMPEFMLNPEIPLNFEGMRHFFQHNIYGQPEAIQTVTDMLVAIKAAVIRRGKPLASLLFAGPTGVGKTEMAKVLAEFMFGNRNRIIRFDMSEYAEYHSLLRLTGDMSVGEGLLTAAIRQEPFSVLLFDELEKVHPAFYDLLLQILGEGRLTDAKGRVADFCSTIVIMTSNLGAGNFQTNSVGFIENIRQQRDVTEHFTREAQAFFRPELFNRLDRIIAFAPLEKEVVRAIVDREIALIRKREGIRGRNIKLTIEKGAEDYLGNIGYNWTYGARFLQRTLHEKLIIPLAENLNRYEFDVPLSIWVSLEKNNIKIQTTKRSESHLTSQLIGNSHSEEITIAEFTTEVTIQRRNAIKIQSGSYYARVLSRLDQLERKLEKLKSKRQEDKFWSDLHQQKEYYELKEIKQDFSEAIHQIQETESENFLLLNGFDKNANILYQNFNEWFTVFTRLKERLITFENPEFLTCNLCIYGNEAVILQLADMYINIAKQKSFKIKAWQIRHTADKIPTLPNEDKFLIIRHDNYCYLRKQYDENQGNDSMLVGVEIELSGQLPFIYFKDENGLHLYVDAKGVQHKYCIVIRTGLLTKDSIPEGMHRKNFFAEKKHRRTYQSKGFKDELYKLQTESTDYEKDLKVILETQFRINVDKYLL
jgi:ATP-dependent Clp protease ATP-binding subunit ClpA